MRFHYKVNPEELSLKEWAKLVGEYQFIMKLEDLRLERVITKVASKIYGKAENESEFND